MRRAVVAVVGLSLAGVASLGFALLPWPAARPEPGHNPFHVNCPPGSHKPWSADHGKAFNAARARRGASPAGEVGSDETGAAADISARALTRGRDKP